MLMWSFADADKNQVMANLVRGGQRSGRAKSALFMMHSLAFAQTYRTLLSSRIADRHHDIKRLPLERID